MAWDLRHLYTSLSNSPPRRDPEVRHLTKQGLNFPTYNTI